MAGRAKRASVSNQDAGFWQRFAIRRIEDLANVVLGAGLEAVQISGPPIRGSLAFAARSGIIFSSGLIQGTVAVNGPLSADAIALGIGLHFGRNSRQWLNRVNDGDVVVVLPGDSHDAVYTHGSLYVAATLSAQQLADAAKREGLTVERRLTSQTGLHPRPIPQPALAALRQQIALVHRCGNTRECHSDVGDAVLRTVLEHYARLPATADRRVQPTGRARIVARAREHIRTHLARSLTLTGIAEAAGTSCRTLSRAFLEVLDITPCDYVLRLRLHRIRQDLVSQEEAATAIATIAARWGMKEPGRMSGWYHDVFGELPSATRQAWRSHFGQNGHLL